MWQIISEMTITWWNTGLSPPTKRAKERPPEDLQRVIEEIKSIYTAQSFQILGLCEVNEENINAILKSISIPHLKYHFHPHINNNVIADTAIIYDERYLKILENETWIDTYGRFETIKVGDAITFYLEILDEFITVVLSHWPSQLTYEEEHPHRIEIAVGHRKRLDTLRNSFSGIDPFIILMGDYNAEPFSTSMAKHLLATRDRELVLRYQDMLYNPFWRHIGESLPHTPDYEVESVGGTCFSSGDRYRRWASFDQIIFSRRFLQSSSIVLDEAQTGILSNSSLKAAIEGKSCIDHFPVTSTIQLRKKL